MKGDVTAREKRPLIHMVWTRAIDGQPLAGRLVVARQVREAARQIAEVRESVLCSSVESGGGGTIRAGMAWLVSVFRGPLLPVQCVLYAGADARRVADEVDPATSVVYLDGVRSFAVLRRLRARFPGMRIVVDFDDLMSRRMALLIEAGEGLSPGHLSNKMSALTKWLIRKLGHLLVRYERWTLPRLEREITRLADATVLLSSADRADLDDDSHATCYTILPAVSVHSLPSPLDAGPIRFVFIGSDVLTQNRMTIDYLLDLWRNHSIDAELVLYGRQVRPHPTIPKVRFAGYVQDIAEVYDGRSVLLSPALLRGGIKTKVLEAFSYGAAVVGNAATFEALPLQGYPLICDGEAALLAIIADPAAARAQFDAAAQIGSDYLAKEHAPERFVQQWRRALGAEGTVAPASRTAGDMPRAVAQLR